MIRSAVLTPDAIALLLTLMEQREPLLSGAAAAMCEKETALLMEAGLLVSHGHEDVAARPGDDEDVPVSLFWSDTLSGLAAFSPIADPVLVPTERLIRHRVEVAAFLAAAAANLNHSPPSQPSDLSNGLVWDLGNVRLGKRPQRNSIWFARRLSDRAVQKQVEDALAARPHPRLRVLLTSSRAERLDGLVLPGVSIVPLRDVLATPDALTVSDEILGASLGGVPASEPGGPVTLSSDERTLTINGNAIFTFKPEPHIAAIRKLFKAYEQGRGLTVGELTEHGSLDRLFGVKRWKDLSPFLKSRGGLWRLEP